MFCRDKLTTIPSEAPTNTTSSTTDANSSTTTTTTTTTEAGIEGSSTSQENTQNDGTESQEKLNKLALRFECLELTSLENKVTEKCVVTFEEVWKLFTIYQQFIIMGKINSCGALSLT